MIGMAGLVPAMDGGGGYTGSIPSLFTSSITA
jgi:hypothetical protein